MTDPVKCCGCVLHENSQYADESSCANCRACNRADTKVVELEALVAALEARAGKLRAAAERAQGFTDHRSRCAARFNQQVCDCGLNEVDYDIDEALKP